MRNLAKTFLALSILVTLSACPKNKNNDVVNQTVNGYQNQTYCAGLSSGQEFLTTESQEINNLFTICLGFLGSSTNINNYGYNPSQYSGSVAVGRGQLIVQQGFYMGYCFLPAGTYSVGTVNSGSYYNGIVTNLKLQASGPANLIIQMNAAQIASPTNRDQWGFLLPSQRLFSTNSVIESMNGQYCQAPISFR